MFALILAELLEFQLRRTFCHTDIRAIISTAALATLKPDMFPFALLFGHKIYPNLGTATKTTHISLPCK
jgi:hypothetical protein